MRTLKFVVGAFLVLPSLAVILALAGVSLKSGSPTDTDRLLGALVCGGFSIAFGVWLIASSRQKN